MADPTQRNKTLDIVVPVYNEECALEEFHRRLSETIQKLYIPVTVFYVNDGSTDGTSAVLKKLRAHDPSIKIIDFSRNFGHQAALTAGLDLSRGDVVITMDGDGQHPAKLIPKMLDLYSAGYDIVLTQRTNDQKLSPFKRVSSNSFYWLIDKIGSTRIIPGSADFRLMSRQAVDALKSMPEYHRFIRGMVNWIGFSTIILPFESSERIAGSPKFSLRKMIDLARNAVFSFSLIPLYLGIGLGCIFLFFSLLEMIFVLSYWISGRSHLLVPGWSSLMFVILISSGMLMIVMGSIGIYIGHIYQEVKRRPTYIIKEGDSINSNHNPTIQS